MATRRSQLLALAALLTVGAAAPAASVQSTNFIVQAPTPELAREFARLAERYRKEKALEWLGREMPNWSQPCNLRVSVTGQGAGGATTFNFGPNQVQQEMHIEGALERLKNSVLPHEVTHTVFAHHFRQPVPRWADEGGSVYSEDDIERNRHDQMCRQILNAGRGIPLRRLFNLRDYPHDVMVLYAEGYSVTRFLVESSDRQTFLNFIAHGMSQRGWDDAVRTFYGYRSIDEVEQAWLDHLRKGRGASAVARGNAPQREQAAGGYAAAENKLVVRQSAWPTRPELDPPAVARGLSPAADGGSRGEPSASGWSRPPASLGAPQVLASATRSPAPAREEPAPAAAPVKQRPAPPPVVLFPPEPLPK